MDKVIYCEDNVYEIDTYIFDYLLEIGFDNVLIYPYNPINNIIRFEYNNTYVLHKSTLPLHKKTTNREFFSYSPSCSVCCKRAP